MGWSIPTYDGIEAHGRPSNLRLAMFELIRGIGERNIALGGTNSFTWWVAAYPDLKQNPTFDELEFLKCTGNKTGGTTANANKAYRNMVLIKERILQMITTGRFVTASGGSTKYTQASMEAAIGTTLDDPESVTEARWWQAMQDALDLMIHAWSELVPDNFVSATGSRSNSNSVLQAAWDDRASISTPTGLIGLSNPKGAWGMSAAGGGLFVAVIHDGSSSIDFMLSIFASETILEGDVVFAEYKYTSLFDYTTVTDFEVDLDGDIIQSFSAESSTSSATVSIGSRINKSLSIVTSEPSTVPFTNTGFQSGLVGISITGLNVQHDISTILTDQA